MTADTGPDDGTAEVISNIGHNQPPSEHVRALDDLEEALRGFVDRRDQFIAAAKRAVLRDRASIGDAGDIIHLANQVWERIDVMARQARAPFRATADRIKSRADAFWEPVWAAHRQLQDKIDVWMQDEADRIDAQRAEQEAVLGNVAPATTSATVAPVTAPGPELKPAATPAPKPQPIRGDLGSRVSRRADTLIEVVDVYAVPDFILKSPAVTEAIIATVRSMAKAGTEIPGIRTAPISRTSIS